jgi:hypothetical protein
MSCASVLVGRRLGVRFRQRSMAIDLDRSSADFVEVARDRLR